MEASKKPVGGDFEVKVSALQSQSAITQESANVAESSPASYVSTEELISPDVNIRVESAPPAVESSLHAEEGISSPADDGMFTHAGVLVPVVI